MQNDIILDQNLQFYSYSGRNIEIIHIYEKKCSFKGVIRYAIYTHQNDLVDYYLDNYENELEKDLDDYIEVLKKFEDDDENPYKKLNYESLKDIVGAMNWKIIFHCLRKIVFIVENYEENSSQNLREGTLIEQSFDDVTLFRFLYSHKREEYKFSNANLFPYIKIAFHNSTSAFKFVLKSENDDEKVLWNVFRILVTDCPSRIIPVIDLLGEDKEGSLYSFFECQFNFQMWLYLLIRYNEDVVVKIIELFDDLFEMTFG
ncbi:hypothetical protein M9Y10_028768 [Tritrichomonas musculus]|uniref:DUF3447 domain-containing protein n=1 Tax=Tritrichomonas musculus TaxID=1915356 RepID=A0ABR2KKA5_9EUKA